MLAVVVATDQMGDLDGCSVTPGFLLPMGDRPFLQHVVECLVQRGVTQVKFVFESSDEKASAFLGDGSRWGCIFHFHCMSRAGLKPLLREITAGVPGKILFARADRMPLFQSDPAHALPERTCANELKTTFYTIRGDTDDANDIWSGWALFVDRFSFREHLNINSEHTLLFGLDHVTIGERAVLQSVTREISVTSGVAVLESQRDLLSGVIPDLLLGGRQLKPGIWVARNVSVHPTATLEAPVYLGPNSQVGQNAHVGPFAVLAEDCIIGAESCLSDALIGPGTYVGEALEIREAIVDHDRFIDVRLGTWYSVTDKFLLGSLASGKPSHVLRRLTDRVIACLLLVIFSPVLVFTFLSSLVRKEALLADDVIRIPEGPEPDRWKSFRLPRLVPAFSSGKTRAVHFVSVFLPGLFSVIKGDLSLVGVKPRSAIEVESLPEDWRALYLKTKAGLITDAMVYFGASPTSDELCASECYYSATENFSNDLKLLSQYLLKLSKYEADHNSPNNGKELRNQPATGSSKTLAH
jgi:acetyltransferase-like isoleucine patch superfamily enzyme